MITKRYHRPAARMKRLMPPANSLVLCLQHEPPGSFMIDGRGQWYLMPGNRAGLGAGIHKMNAKQILAAVARGIVPRPSMTLYDLLELVVRQ